MKNKQIILASASPRRKELLELMGLTFQIVPSTKEEVVSGDSPDRIVEQLSHQKAEDVASRMRAGDTIVIGADTIVVCGGEIMGKPRSEEEAVSMLRRLQGRGHEVYTGVTIICRGTDSSITSDTFSEKANVSVHPMSDGEIRAYVARGESLDKAGAYGIQGIFSVFVDEIRGEYSTILGLPVAGLYQALKRFL